MASSLVSSSRQTMKLRLSSSIARTFPALRAGASVSILSSMSGCPRQLFRPLSFAHHICASRARTPTSASTELPAPRSIAYCSGSSPSPVVVLVCNGKLDWEREILSDLLSKMGIPESKIYTLKLCKQFTAQSSPALDEVEDQEAAFFPYISADDPDLSATAKASKAAATRSLARGSNCDAIKSMLVAVPQLSSLVTFLKLGFEKFMSILKDARFQGQHPPRDYGAFISYKQEDTLRFVRHLKSALDRRGIKTFVDFTLEGGVEVRPAIEEAIERSKIAVVIVSPNYHLSPWCLIELEKILECQRTRGLIVLPILRGMDAKDLREQSRHFVENIGQGEKGFNQEQPRQFQKWRDALRALGMINALPVLRSSILREAVDAAEAADAADQISAKVSRSA